MLVISYIIIVNLLCCITSPSYKSKRNKTNIVFVLLVLFLYVSKWLTLELRYIISTNVKPNMINMIKIKVFRIQSC